MELLTTYFPELTEKQRIQFAQLDALYKHWNEKINVISRKDIDLLYERHILHSLGIAKVMAFKPGTRVMDIGTGGGFPGIPLAILFPESSFLLIDSIGKKIKVVQEVAQAIGLTNLTAVHGRAEEVDEKFHFIVSRAVTRLKPFYNWTKNKYSAEQFNDFKNGILYLKGGDLEEEVKELNKPVQLFNLSDFFKEEFFETKKVLYLPVNNVSSKKEK
ncbi:MAG TPA: 16S rRNA (guanine(527)-N(7))-methyltransferase RsmG [Cytophagaceae bacterium]|nr:16S rRNA (guanine(527)-N(7))-methyltransferase RsmG [Cytophagaceae bacterium]